MRGGYGNADGHRHGRGLRCTHQPAAGFFRRQGRVRDPLLPGGETANHAARFWSRIFAVTFIIGVVTGIPLEFGTNRAVLSSDAGNIIGQTLAREGAFAFFLE
jgi:hypothetical protein